VPGRPPLVARSWRAVTPGQREAPTPTTAPGYARQPRRARLPWTARAWWLLGKQLPATPVLGTSVPSTVDPRGTRAPGGAGGRPPASNQWRPPQHEAGAARPAALGVPRAALTGPPTAAVAALPLRLPRAVRPCPPTTPAPPAVGNPADSGGSPAVQRLFEHGCADRSAACGVDTRRLPTLASARADRCPLTTPQPPARGTKGARWRLPSWPARAPTRRPARPTRR